MKRADKKGVTLVEIAIVLVIIGLLLGGVLKGQELINNAKIRAIADRQNSLKVAWFAFIDRYQALPGDYVFAPQYIKGSVKGNGDGVIIENESPVVFQHLTAAGYLRCPQCTTNKDGGAKPSALNSLQNTYQHGGIMAIFADSAHYMVRGGASGSAARLMIHTGPRIPSNILSEVDRKLDDGNANTGDFVFNNYDAQGTNPSTEECVTTTASKQTGTSKLYHAEVAFYRHADSNPPVEPNCGGSVSI
jgi:prepilin-type N-terminal cleavage/methylation domain-containing protein